MSLAMLATAGLLSLSPSLRAEDAAAPATPPAKRAGGPRLSAEEQLKTLTEKLKLTPDQFKQYEEIQKQMGPGARRNAGTNAPAAGEGKKKKTE